MKKCLVSVLICLILTNFICINYCYADDEEITGEYTADSWKRASEDGTANINGEEVSAETTGSSVIGTVVGLGAKILAAFPMLIHYFVSSTLNYGGIIGNESNVDAITIQNIITGKYFLLDCNVFTTLDNVNSTETKNGETKGISETLVDIRAQVSTWFIIIRDVSMALNLAVLLYIAIRVAIATVAQDKAKYKELLYNWLISMIILFMLPYIFVVINTVSDSLVNIAESFMESMENAGNESFENEIIYQVMDSFTTSGGLTYGLYTIIYFILIWTEVKFFAMYGKRVFTVFFLIIISPIITVTYSIDKIGDGKAQAYSKWMNQYMNNLFVQPLHCFTYLVFMYTANNIAKQVPLVAIIFLLSLTKAEKIVKKLLNVSASTVENVGDKFSVKGVKGKLKGMVPKGGGK